ncbi:hypothetical protein H6G97_02815 [Nostoc flagelliforme FACHB-838]|uniref:Uncharacterized protein n=1 Tax=Nostoc flagelliforme FACHB-838 TaxID=2692904 RepID=A0ABR8DG86_9NOSO|nr:hypothetical protein [Nostoc flagelliforme]MBD2528547.1 hypothetical protein [Nostoc flagelliforme FACHB-838]
MRSLRDLQLKKDPIPAGGYAKSKAPTQRLLAMPTAAGYEGLHQAQSPVPYQDLHSSITFLVQKYYIAVKMPYKLASLT